MPVRNEAGAIGPALQAVLDQRLDHGEVEVIVIDGSSTDTTVAEAEHTADAAGRQVTIFDNPAGIVPISMNIGLRHATGAVIVRVDGHCEIPPGYVQHCLDLLDAHPEADCVGGALETVGEGAVARGIAEAQSSIAGVGNATFRTGATEGRFVDTLAFGAYRREVFDRIGGFDEELVRNQDDELNLRLTQDGRKIWLDPTVVVRYHSRASLRGLRRQYFQYGLYKVRVLQKRGTLASARQLVPTAFVLALGGSAALGLARRELRWPALVLVPYAVVVAAATADVARRDPPAAPSAAAAVPIMHLAYGTGFLAGFWRWRQGFRRSSSASTPEVPTDVR